MTDKEKAQAYDEALERARKQKYDYQKEFDKTDKNSQLAEILRAGMSAIELAFPELAENEDEKIRKEINILYSDIDTCISELLKARTDKDSEAEGKALFKMEGLMVGTLQDLSCIEDYLEKQKEPHYTKRNALFDKCVANCDPAIMKRVSDEVDEKLKEQNPAEYLDLDNASQDYVYNHFCQGADFTPDYIKGLMEDAFIDGANWQKEQKPLSTEETELNSIAFLEQMGYTCIPPGAKPAKWSEEDEDTINLMIAILRENHPDSQFKTNPVNTTCMSVISTDMLIKRIESLRPSKDCSSCAKHLEGYISGRSDAENKLLEQFGALITPEDELHIKPRWKPSEEQMRYLLAVINDPNNAGAESCHLILESLYNDLKKL